MNAWRTYLIVFPVQQLLLKGKQGSFMFQKFTSLSLTIIPDVGQHRGIQCEARWHRWDLCRSSTSPLFAYLIEPTPSFVNFLSMDFLLLSGHLLWIAASWSGTFRSWKPELISIVKSSPSLQSSFQGSVFQTWAPLQART